jgi:hypothetical protein
MGKRGSNPLGCGGRSEEPEPGDEQEGAWPRERLLAMDMERASSTGPKSRAAAAGNPLATMR